MKKENKESQCACEGEYPNLKVHGKRHCYTQTGGEWDTYNIKDLTDNELMGLLHGDAPKQQKEVGRQDVNKDIEEAYPEAYRLARKFHDLYEEVAPQFGYKTRGDTKAFEPASPNGRTMAYVCKNIVDEEVEVALLSQKKQLREKIAGMREKAHTKSNGRYKALTEVLALLDE